MRKSRHTEEQIIGILNESKSGVATAEPCRKQGMNEQTFYRWKANYGSLEVSEARLRQLDEENHNLKQLVPPASRQLEECRAMEQYSPRATRFASASEQLRVRLRDLADQRDRWGYRRPHVLLRRVRSIVTSKRVYRIYVAERLAVRRRKRRRRICAQARVLLGAPTRLNETWTMEFLQDALANGRKFRTLSIEDASAARCWPSRSTQHCPHYVLCVCWRSSRSGAVRRKGS